jgi:hypothetical protein
MSLDFGVESPSCARDGGEDGVGGGTRVDGAETYD